MSGTQGEVGSGRSENAGRRTRRRFIKGRRRGTTADPFVPARNCKTENEL